MKPSEAVNTGEESLEFKDVVEEQQDMEEDDADARESYNSSFESDSEEECEICQGKSPPGYKGVKVDWIACEGCSLWFHNACLECKQVDENNDWFYVECDLVDF